MIITSALMIWKSLVLGTGSESPVRPSLAAGASMLWLAAAASKFSALRDGWAGVRLPLLLLRLTLVTEFAERGRQHAATRLAPRVQVVVVLSGSMEPGFYRGDILFLYQPKQPVDTGDISKQNWVAVGSCKLDAGSSGQPAWLNCCCWALLADAAGRHALPRPASCHRHCCASWQARLWIVGDEHAGSARCIQASWKTVNSTLLPVQLCSTRMGGRSPSFIA